MAARFTAVGQEYERVKTEVNALGLHTVCKEAACPNVAECWGAGTATIMILGDTCTRGCRFCNVKTGNPRGEVDWLEPMRVAEAVRDLGWKYLVLTAVDRDDLADGGALIFANTVRAIHERVPGRESRSLAATTAAISARSTSCSTPSPMCSRTISRRCAGSRRGARQAGGIRSVAGGSRARQAARATALYEDLADARPRRDANPKSRSRWTMRAPPASTSSRWASTCSRARSTCPSPSS